MSGTIRKPAVVLLSGGLDSATTAAMAKSQAFDLHALHFAYGQRHAIELESARRVAASLGIERFLVFPVDLRAFGGSALTADMAVPKPGKLRPSSEGFQHPPIPITYVPARNTVFLSLALAYAEVHGIYDIFIGVNAMDYSGYPDCRPEFVAAFEELANLGTKAGAEGMRFHIHAPLIRMNKAEIIREGVRLGVNYSLTHSCYDPDESGRACGACESCLLRRRGFESAGVADPTRYSS